MTAQIGVPAATRVDGPAQTPGDRPRASCGDPDSELRHVAVTDIKVGSRFREDLGDLSGLVESIRRVGLLHPVVVDAELNLIAGERRLAAVKSLGLATIPAHVVSNLRDATDVLYAERDENTCRKAMTPSEAVALGRELEGLLKPMAAESRRQGAIKRWERERAGGDACVTVTQASRHKPVRDAVAAAVGMSGPTYARAKKVVAAAETGDPVAVEAKREMDRTGNAHGALRKIEGKATRVHARNRNADELLTGVRSSLGAVAMTLRNLDFSDVPVDPEWAKELQEAIGLVRKLRSALQGRN